MSKATNIQSGSVMYTVGCMLALTNKPVAVTVGRQRENDFGVPQFRCRRAGKRGFSWIVGTNLYPTESAAWAAIASALHVQANQFLDAAKQAARNADAASRIACERGEATDCPDQHLCRHGIDN